MGLCFELRLDERRADRVFVSVLLSPEGEVPPIEGVGVELFGRGHESLSPRMLLPIAGRLSAPIAVKVELRAHAAIPPGAMVAGTVWWENDAQCASCPADPSTELEAHLRGKRCVRSCAPERDLMSLSDEERDRLAHCFPWIDAVPACPSAAVEDDALDAFDPVDELTDELGLCAEDARWLKELLTEEE